MYTSKSEGGLTFPVRDGGEEEGSRREMVWDIVMIHGVFMPGEVGRGEGTFTPD